jgi:hypothetical protein
MSGALPGDASPTWLTPPLEMEEEDRQPWLLLTFHEGRGGQTGTPMTP